METASVSDQSLLTSADGSPVRIINGHGKAKIALVCEHASATLPAALGDLGLTDEARASHIAWDPGAMAVADRLATALDAPLLAGGFSRLVYDCNRPPESASAIPERSEATDIPGNRHLSSADRARRIEEIYQPFRAALAALVDRIQPVLVTIHSFTPVFLGKRRTVELGLLHDKDSRLADALLARAASTGLRVARNEPYGPEDGVTHTLQTHALPHGLPNVMVEIRSDLIADPAGQRRLANILLALLKDSLVEIGAGSSLAGAGVS